MSVWYPSQKAFEELTITETEEGFEFSAPDESECAKWLAYYNSTEELQEEFSAEIIKALENYLDKAENGSSQQDTQRNSEDREQAEIN